MVSFHRNTPHYINPFIAILAPQNLRNTSHGIVTSYMYGEHGAKPVHITSHTSHPIPWPTSYSAAAAKQKRCDTLESETMSF